MSSRSIHLFLADMAEVVFLKSRVVRAEDLRIGFGELASLELDVSKLDCADAIGNL